MRIYLLAVFVAVLVTLTVKLLLIRVFDVIMMREIAYVIITCAMFAFGAAGVFLSLRPGSSIASDVHRAILFYALASALFLLLIRPAINISGLDLVQVVIHPVKTMSQLIFIYLFLVLPFFFLGILIVKILSLWSEQV